MPPKKTYAFMRRKLMLTLLCITFGLGALSIQADTPPPAPKLILQLTIDQLRGDLLTQHRKSFGPNGFNHLLNNGLVFSDAHHPHATTETIVGHTTIATGAMPAVHGMIGNTWYDRTLQRGVYTVDDPDYPLLDDKISSLPKSTNDTGGRSPRNILTTTLGDEMKRQSEGKAKVFSVSIKDRSAIAMAGHDGKAFWFSPKKRKFISSTYYYKQLPAWVAEWHKKDPVAAYAGQAWILKDPLDTYRFADNDKQAWESNYPGFGITFPHAYGKLDDKYFTTLLTISPAGDKLTLDFALELIQHENIGQDAITDYLSISFSSTDYIGHAFGPNSLESEDNLRHLDAYLAELFSAIDKQVGLNNTLIVLSADHGVADSVGYRQHNGLLSQGLKNTELNFEEQLSPVKQQFKLSSPIIEITHLPYIYLKPEIINSRTNLLDFELAAAKELEKIPYIHKVYSSEAFRLGKVEHDDLSWKVRNTLHTGRSGNLYIVFKPNTYVNNFDGKNLTGSHGSPWFYDTHVPIIFLGKGIAARTSEKRVYTNDISQTLATLLGIDAPPGSQGENLLLH